MSHRPHPRPYDDVLQTIGGQVDQSPGQFDGTVLIDGNVKQGCGAVRNGLQLLESQRSERPEGAPLGVGGGPLVDRLGRVIGICSMGSKKKGMYCHLQEIHQFLTQSGF